MINMSKYLDENGLLYYDGKVKNRLNNKVDKVEGKTLSTNDYTTEEKTKLSNIEEGAQVNVIETININGTEASISGKKASINIEAGKIDVIKVNGVAQEIKDKAVDIDVPTKTSELENNSNFVVDANYVHTDNNYTTTEKNKLKDIAANAQVNVIETIKVNNAIQTITNKSVDITVPTNNNQLVNGAGYQNASEVQGLINTALENITTFDFQVVNVLPTNGVKGVIYLVPNSGKSPNVYDEYIWLGVDKKYEKIGTTDINLNNYWSKTELVSITNEEIDNITK